MTCCNCTEDSPVSGEYSQALHGRFSLFSQPSEVDHWSRTISIGNLPTPPDTNSDCATSDCADMSQPWMVSSPEEQWMSAPDYSTAHTFTAQDMPAMNTSAWLNYSNGHVDLGLSPVLSYSSENAHSLNNVPEQDIALLPSSLDFSFLREPCWNPAHQDTWAVSQPMPGVGSVPHFGAPSHGHMEYASCPTAPQSMYPEAHQPVLFQSVHQPLYLGQPMPTGYPGQTVAAEPAAIFHRTVLPKAGQPDVTPTQRVYGPLTVLRPQVRAQDTRSVMTNVSCPTVASGKPAVPSGLLAGRVPAPCISPVLSPRSGLPFTAGQLHGVPDRSGADVTPASAADDMCAFFHFEDTNQPIASEANSYASGVPCPATGLSVAPNHHQDLETKATSVSSEMDEGRHRTHPLYSEGPKADGMYHCPFEGEPGCQHKPNKLKCNYDKFIDSHLKPFRCKYDSCSKQEFSSTACLLRHEREAHGLHGHGDRPHLCYYNDCERSIPGNGFPRRYNLFDHMKRVHDHKEDPSDVSNSPVNGGVKRSSGRKRKALSPHAADSVAQRPRIVGELQQLPPPAIQPVSRDSKVQPMPVQYHGLPVSAQVPQHGQYMYQPWADHKELFIQPEQLAQIPDDAASLVYTRQHFVNTRQLSQDAKRT